MTPSPRQGPLQRGPGIAILLALLAAGLAGCAQEEQKLAVTHVLSHGHCREIGAGVTPIDLAQLARVRGSRLLEIGEPDGAGNGSGGTAGPEAESTLLLLAISRGEQPTPGYGFALRGSSRHGGEGLIRVEWYTPSADSVQAQVLTHPCLVVGVERDGLDSLRVEDQNGDRVGAVDLTR